MNPKKLPVPYIPSGYTLGKKDFRIATEPSLHEVMIEKRSAIVPDALVIILSRILDDNQAGIRLMLEHAPLNQRFPIHTERWEMCDNIAEAIKDNIRINIPNFPELRDFEFTTVRTNTAKMEQSAKRYNVSMPIVDVSFNVDESVRSFPTVIKDSFVRDVGGFISSQFRLSAEEGGDIAREAMLIGTAKVTSLSLDIAETKVPLVTRVMSASTRYSEFSNFSRS